MCAGFALFLELVQEHYAEALCSWRFHNLMCVYICEIERKERWRTEMGQWERGREGERWASTATELATYSRRIVKTAAWGHDLHRHQNLCLPCWAGERVIPHALPEDGGLRAHMPHEISAAPLETALNVYNYTQCWALARIYCARPVRCCVWASNPCCRYVFFKMHMQWITSLAFDRMINYLQRCCKILPSMEWLISRGALNPTEMYELARSRSQLCIFLFWVWLVFGVYECVGGVYVSDGRRKRVRASRGTCV